MSPSLNDIQMKQIFLKKLNFKTALSLPCFCFLWRLIENHMNWPFSNVSSIPQCLALPEFSDYSISWSVMWLNGEKGHRLWLWGRSVTGVSRLWLSLSGGSLPRRWTASSGSERWTVETTTTSAGETASPATPVSSSTELDRSGLILYYLKIVLQLMLQLAISS